MTYTNGAGAACPEPAGGKPVGGKPVGGKPVGGKPVGGAPVGGGGGGPRSAMVGGHGGGTRTGRVSCGKPVGCKPVGGVGGKPVGGDPPGAAVGGQSAQAVPMAVGNSVVVMIGGVGPWVWAQLWADAAAPVASVSWCMRRTSRGGTRGGHVW